MKTYRWIRVLFYASAAYDGILGLLFLALGGVVYSTFGIEPPNHDGYVQFPALLLIVFSILFCDIARRPLSNRNLIVYAILFKLSYSGVVFFHWSTGSIPNLWIPFAIIDLLLAATYLFTYWELEKAVRKEV